ncbi:hypothetical protein DJ533_14385 [Acinetobacter defluvii]|uniref:Uncharacterized protein n=1 Tax=Acinetobacter defluvii TaxID=1871111 RepID=A0A2S2FFC3_9GAMM|nr:hypothetical protein [Acinetobacter defluvii]AWL29671.1 hypothetical protein DJ533_14385 [Acinetobacter defluvii]
MLIDFISIQKNKFQILAKKIQAQPERFIDFDSVSDFYKATWLNDFPTGTTWAVTGLDNGADEFDILIEYRDLYLRIECTQPIKIYTGMK